MVRASGNARFDVTSSLRRTMERHGWHHTARGGSRGPDGSKPVKSTPVVQNTSSPATGAVPLKVKVGKRASRSMASLGVFCAVLTAQRLRISHIFNSRVCMV